MSATILCDPDTLKETIEEFKHEWIFQVLFELGVTEKALMNNDGVFEEAKDEMDSLGIYVEHDHAKGRISVSLESDVVAEWHPPITTRYIDNNGTHYYNIKLKEWSFLDDGTET